MSVNKVIILGSLTRDPELRVLPNGDPVTNFSLATNERWKAKDGTQKESVEFHNVVTYRKLADICAQYLRKGSQCYIEGKLQTRKWEKDGVTRYSTEIIADTMQMTGGKTDGSQQQNNKPQHDAGDMSDIKDDKAWEDDIGF